VLESLAGQGFGRIVVWRGCGGHQLAEAVDAFNRAQNARAFLPGQPYHDLWIKLGDPRDPGGHADSFTTSIALYLRPDHVRSEKIVDSGCKPVHWQDPDLNFADYAPTGVVGTPIYASAELGKELWQEVVRAVADIFKEISEKSTTGISSGSRLS
jgi:creatinine amidohydrolase